MEQISKANRAVHTTFIILGRFVTAALILGITAFFTPGFSISSLWALAVATIILSILDYLVVRVTGLDVSPFGKGFVGFILSAIVLYITQYLVSGYTMSLTASIVGALVYGAVDYFLPGED